MGQEESKSNAQPHSARTYHYQPTTRPKTNTRIEHEGILKIRSTPFPNCVEISNDGMLLFLQNAQTTLHDLLQSRLYTNRLFPAQDIQRLIENTIYTLAYLSESDCIYRDLCPQNIYYANGQFKLLPNELIEQTFYQKAWENFYGLRSGQQQQEKLVYLSPQLIIALRMKEKSINDNQIINKSNVFIFGLILLQATTLMPSSECYDPSNYDIFNNIVSERLDLVQQHYNESIARIIANMLDYDFNQRMDLKELSIWVNRQLVENREPVVKSYNSTQQKPTLKPQKSSASFQKSRLVTNQPQKVIQNQQNQVAEEEEIQPARCYSRTNIVYINGYDDGTGRQDTYVEPFRGGARNSVYLGNLPQYEVEEQIDKKIFQKQTFIEPAPQREARMPKLSNPYEQQVKYSNPQRFKYDREESLANLREPPSEQQRLTRNYSNYTQKSQKIESIPYVPPPEIRNRQNMNIKSRIYQEQAPLKKLSQNIEDISTSGISVKQRNQNRFYPSISEMENVNQFTDATKRLAKHSEVGKNSQIKQQFDSKQSRQSDSKCSVNDGSINRIKMQIQKSRKLIEQFRKCQGISS